MSEQSRVAKVRGVGRLDRERLSGHQAHVVWLTGLSGAGKSTLARQLEIRLFAKNRRTFVLDGDNLRGGLCKDLGYGLTDRAENVRRVAEAAKILLDAGVISIVALISPIEEQRQLARQIIGSANVTIVHLATPLATCMLRDPKGLYQKAAAGEIRHMTGIDSPYEEPTNPDLRMDTSEMTVEESVGAVLAHLSRMHPGVA